MNNNIEHIKSLLNVLPNKPGIYQFFDKSEKIIYIGKAKNLKKRVSSYFFKKHNSAKTQLLVKKINEIKHTIVDTEEEALLLENNLIKKYRPKYNVLLKDDKTYPWICIKNEKFPRIFLTRRVIKDGSLYFGPYTSVRLVRNILDMLKHHYKTRTCKLKLSDENIQSGKYNVCLEYHIGNCKAPCIGKQTAENYNNSINEIKNILSGNISSVTKHLRKLMIKYSEEYKFELANEVKEKIFFLENFQKKSTVVNPKINNVDVFSIIDDNEYAYINFLKVVNGSIIQAQNIEVKKKLDENKSLLLPILITEIRQRIQSFSKEIIVPFKIDYSLNEVKFIIPKQGDKKKLLELSERNAKTYRLERHKQYDKINRNKHVDRILQTMQKDLHLDTLPVHVEGFDNSNIQGTNPVASCVVFKNAKPSKKDYRKFSIKTVEGANDFASMEEIVFRRYKRLLDEKQSLPQLIIIDGGKGQLSAALKSIDKLELRNKIAIIGIAKRLEEIFFPHDPVPLYLDKNSETLKLIQQVRDEAHRFGISFHRDKRSKEMIKSELDEINGVGEKTKQKLLIKLKSIKNIKKADFNELEKIIGKAKAKLIFDGFHSRKPDRFG
ncbi:MAG: excinuclease ABC subunit UvrC [Bacteroidales bacterium]|nr:excinuclease ABC subunit UvrC [Bacteroidales bacterium]